MALYAIGDLHLSLGVEKPMDVFGSGWTDHVERPLLQVEFPDEVLEKVPEKHRDAVRAVLEADPRPRYQDDPQRIYGLTFAARNIKFRVEGQTLYVVEVEKA